MTIINVQEPPGTAGERHPNHHGHVVWIAGRRRLGSTPGGGACSWQPHHGGLRVGADHGAGRHRRGLRLGVPVSTPMRFPDTVPVTERHTGPGK